MPVSLDLIAIDGPAGSGKSTVAARVARRLKRFHLDTGALYRAVTLAALETKTDLGDEQALAAIVRSARFEFRAGRLFLDGRDISRKIRTPRVTARIHKIAEKPEVRTALRPIQRMLVEGRPSVAEGRDMGSVVFPDARRKFYLDADEKVRARRRFKEWEGGGTKAKFETVLADLRKRDRRDRTRKTAPLVCSPGAVRIDTTAMTIAQVVERIVGVVAASV